MKENLLRTLRVIAPAMLAVLVITACGSSGTKDTPGAQGLFENIMARHHATSRGGGIYASPVDAMPQVRYVIDGGQPISVADAYVVGNFVDAKAGASFRWTEDASEETRHALDFNAEGAQISTIHVTLRIQRSITDPNQPDAVRKGLSPGNDVTFGLALSAPVNVDAAEAELKALGQLVVLLYRPSPVFDYRDDLWAVLEDGAFLGHVRRGVVEFPAFKDPEAVAHAEPASYAVEELEAPRGEPRAVTYDRNTGRYQPTG